MEFLLLNIIRIYWLLIPTNKRRKCIFNKSCSHHVFEEIKTNGVKSGIKELQFRIKNCHPEFDIFTDLKTGRKKIILKTGIVLDEYHIAERLK